MGGDVARDWLQRGQMLEAAGQFLYALEAYDDAITTLTDAIDVGSTGAKSPELRRELGIAWMNRGNAAQKARTPPALAEAVQAYDQAIALFRALPSHPSEARQNHLGAAWLNRGHALLVADDPAAITSFENAIAILSSEPFPDDPFARRNLAGAHTNLAYVLLTSAPARAAESARAALSTIDGYEHRHLDFAAMSLRARRALVMALGALLVDADPAGAQTAEFRAEASDAIEAGLALTLTLKRTDFQELRPLAERLFRLGVQLYSAHQPHFLGEFVLELMAAPPFAEDALFRDIADTALDETLAHVRRPRLVLKGTPAAERLLRTAQSLRAAQEELARRLPRAATSEGR